MNTKPLPNLYWVNIYCDNGRIMEYELEGYTLQEIEDKVMELCGGADIGEVYIEQIDDSSEGITE